MTRYKRRRLHLVGDLLLAVMTVPALADFETIARAYELEPVHVSVPLTADGLLYFRECGNCQTHSAQLGLQTAFRVAGESVSFSRFCEALYDAQASARSLIVLQRHVESNDILLVQVLP